MRFVIRVLWLGCLMLTLLSGAYVQAQQPALVHSDSREQRNQPLRVHFIDVGQGDSILIQAPSGATMLIDGGYPGTGALAYLTELGITRIDVMVASHPHADHIGGLVDVLRALPVGDVWTSGAVHGTGTFEQFLDAIADAKVPYHEAKLGDTIVLDTLHFQVLHSDPEAADLNDSSLVLHLSYDSVSFLFTGDAERTAEHDMLRDVKDLLPSTILKVGHHGSYTSSSREFLDVVRPAVAIYSAGKHNSYGHPHDSVIQNLERVRAKIYGTDSSGTVVVSTDGRTYTIATDAGRPSQPTPGAVTSIPTRVPPLSTRVPAITPTPRAAVPTPPNSAALCYQEVNEHTVLSGPVVITAVDKKAEVVTIRDISGTAIDISGWTICSLLGSQRHAYLEGTLGANETRPIPSQAHRPIWNNRARESAAIYNNAGQLVAYWREEQH
jgi:competence protein ComEC